jgi:hypothetical protein
VAAAVLAIFPVLGGISGSTSTMWSILSPRKEAGHSSPVVCHPIVCESFQKINLKITFFATFSGKNKSEKRFARHFCEICGLKYQKPPKEKSFGGFL